MKNKVDLVFIIDDDDSMRELAQVICRQMNLKTHEVGDTVAARKWLDANVPSLILLDIMMPDGNGVEFCKWIRGQEGLKETPVIVASALKEEETIQDAFDMGASDFLSKPFNIAAFKEKVGRFVKAENT